MKALSLTQPWASLVAIGAKTIETRNWTTAHRGPVAIHAAKGFPEGARYICHDEPFGSTLRSAGILRMGDLPLGAIIAKLPSGQQKILQYLLDIHPDAISRADLGSAVGYNLTGGTGAQHIADLVTVGAVSIPQQGKVKASDLLFPQGLV
ncbi:MAG TPA: hypothetical protein VFN76_09870 [Candidatus Limnocylindria bacterium]|nr:hypothetical protein [Candidatus Limnocylindria bacterium]